MSLDIYAAIDTGGDYPHHLNDGINITHNCRAQVVACGVDPWEWEGRSIKETLQELRSAVIASTAHENAVKLKALDPASGWGSLQSTQRFLRDMLELAEQHPKAQWSVSR
jgi:hypothetical protein